MLVVHEAGSSAEELEAPKPKPVDLILSGNNMPSMEGLELLRQNRARRRAPGVPAMMITTDSSEEYVKQGTQTGALGSIRKLYLAGLVNERVLPLLQAA